MLIFDFATVGLKQVWQIYHSYSTPNSLVHFLFQNQKCVLVFVRMIGLCIHT
jgi:hypothetical protein